MTPNVLPSIPAKRYFTIGEVAELCGVKPHVLRYWEQEFTQLAPMKRRGNRRYYQHHEVLMVRRIRDLLYEQGFTISGARIQLQSGKITELAKEGEANQPTNAAALNPLAPPQQDASAHLPHAGQLPALTDSDSAQTHWPVVRQELQAIRQLLS